MKEMRWFKASVREMRALCQFRMKDFHLNVTITGSHDALTKEAITLINDQGFEVHHIKSQSINRETL